MPVPPHPTLSPSASPPSASSWTIAIAGAALVIATLAAYANSFHGPFVYDDVPSIVENASLRHWTTALFPPGGGVTVSGRPVLNLSFALNYACGGLGVTGYHLGNIVIHLLAGLTLFGLLRRTLQQPGLKLSLRAAALPVAWLSAALWMLHPLQTEAVTYVVQRAESLMALCYLLTLYCCLRGTQSAHPWRWYIGCLAACLLGMGTKENMVSAPLIVLLFDRTFVAGSFAAAWRQRGRLHSALATTWIVLALLVLSTGGNRAGSAGLGVSVPWSEYVLTQFPALVRYLSLSFWPHPLVFDYGAFSIERIGDIVLPACLAAVVITATAWAVWRQPAVGFAGGFFFAILAPTFLLPGVVQRIVEHRMYLPLASVIVLVVAGVCTIAGRRTVVWLMPVVIVLAFLTFRRNHDYRSALALWQDTVAKAPSGATAHVNLGQALSQAARLDEAIVETETALRLQAGHVGALSNLGILLVEANRIADALPLLEKAIRLNPTHANTQLNLGVALDKSGRPNEALPHHHAAVRLNPESALARNNLGSALCRAGQIEEGIFQLLEALRLQPDYPDVDHNLIIGFAKAGRLTDARRHLDAALQRDPLDPEAHRLWADALHFNGRTEESLAEYATALRWRPNDAALHYDYGNALAASDRLDDAVLHFTEALRLRADFAEAHNNLANSLYLLRREADALPHYREALRLDPRNALARNNAGLALARLGQLADAEREFAEAVRIAPEFTEARENLLRARSQLRAE